MGYLSNTQYQNGEDFEGLAYENMEEVETKNNGNGLEKADPKPSQESPQVLTSLSVFFKNEVTRLQALVADLEAKKQKVEKQVQINRGTLERLSLVEKQAQEIISESIKVRKENEAILQRQVVKEKTVNDDANESLTLQQIWR